MEAFSRHESGGSGGSDDSLSNEAGVLFVATQDEDCEEIFIVTKIQIRGRLMGQRRGWRLQVYVRQMQRYDWCV